MYVIWAALAFAAIQVRECVLAANLFLNEILNCCPGYYKYARDDDSFRPYFVWGIDEHQSKGSKHLNTELLNHAWSKSYCCVHLYSIRFEDS